MSHLLIGTRIVVSSAHFVQTSGGKCKNLHGHSWEFLVEVSGIVKNDGMVVDFGEIKDTIGILDHKVLVPTESNQVKIQYQKMDMPGQYVSIVVSDFDGSKMYILPEHEICRVGVPQITAEHLARFFARNIKESCHITGWVKVTVFESEDSFAEWKEE